MLDKFQLQRLKEIESISFTEKTKYLEYPYAVISKLIVGEFFYYIRYTKLSPVFYCFKKKEDYYSNPQIFTIFKLKELEKMLLPKPRQTTIFDYIGA